MSLITSDWQPIASIWRACSTNFSRVWTGETV
jgi:hypothetical protein